MSSKEHNAYNFLISFYDKEKKVYGKSTSI